MIANLKKSFKLLTYAYKFKKNLVCNGLLLVATGILYTLSFVLQANLFLFVLILLYLGITMPSQMREDLLHSQMIASSGFRRFFDIHFGDIYFFVSSILTYIIHGVLLLLFFEEGAYEGESLTGLLVVAGVCTGAMTISFAVVNKKFFTGFLMYFVVGFFHGFGNEVIKELIDGGFVSLSQGSAFIIGLVLAVIGCLVAMWLRRWAYKKPYCRFSTTDELNKAMQQ